MKVHHSLAAVALGGLLALAPAASAHADVCPPADTFVTDEGPVAVDYPADCERPTATPAPKPKAKPWKHRVRRGETLWGLSKHYYGTGTKWRAIAKASGVRGTMIHRGTLLTIPRKA